MENEEAGFKLAIPCRHLRSKEMYYQDYGQAEDDYSSGLFWCGKTQETCGPDGGAAGKTECCTGRTCYIS